jgi:hypothetical protein
VCYTFAEVGQGVAYLHVVRQALATAAESDAVRAALCRTVARWSWLAEWLNYDTDRDSPPLPLPQPAPAPAAFALQAGPVLAAALDRLRRSTAPGTPELPPPPSPDQARLRVEGAGAAGANGTYWQWHAKPCPSRLAVVYARPAGCGRLWLLFAWRLTAEEAIIAAGPGRQAELEAEVRRRGVAPNEMCDPESENAAAAVAEAVAAGEWGGEDVSMAAATAASLDGLLGAARWHIAEVDPGCDWLQALSDLTSPAGSGSGRVVYKSAPAPMPSMRALALGTPCWARADAADGGAAEPLQLFVVREAPMPGAQGTTVRVEPADPARCAGAGGGAAWPVRIPRSHVASVMLLPPERGWAAMSADVLSAPPILVRCPLMASGAGLGGGGGLITAVEVVDLCGGPEGTDDLVGKLREKISELTGASLSEAKARQLLEKGGWTLDNATMAFFDSMD